MPQIAGTDSLAPPSLVYIAQARRGWAAPRQAGAAPSPFQATNAALLEERCRARSGDYAYSQQRCYTPDGERFRDVAAAARAPSSLACSSGSQHQLHQADFDMSPALQLGPGDPQQHRPRQRQRHGDGWQLPGLDSHEEEQRRRRHWQYETLSLSRHDVGSPRPMRMASPRPTRRRPSAHIDGPLPAPPPPTRRRVSDHISDHGYRWARGGGGHGRNNDAYARFAMEEDDAAFHMGYSCINDPYMRNRAAAARQLQLSPPGGQQRWQQQQQEELQQQQQPEWSTLPSVATRTFPMTQRASSEMLRLTAAHAKHQLVHGTSPPKEVYGLGSGGDGMGEQHAQQESLDAAAAAYFDDAGGNFDNGFGYVEPRQPRPAPAASWADALTLPPPQQAEAGCEPQRDRQFDYRQYGDRRGPDRRYDVRQAPEELLQYRESWEHGGRGGMPGSFGEQAAIPQQSDSGRRHEQQRQQRGSSRVTIINGDVVKMDWCAHFQP